MGFYAKTMLFIRRLSVFYLIVGVFSVFFGFFYYKYIPDNQAEVNTRGFRILNQLAGNLAAKDANVADVLFNANHCSTCVAKDRDSLLSQISERIPVAPSNLSIADTSVIRDRQKPDTATPVIQIDKKPDTVHNSLG